MIVLILTLLDLISLVIISLAQFNSHPPFQLILMAGAYLLSKPFIFKDFMSWVDFGAGVYFIFSLIFGGVNLIFWMIFVWFIYKLIITILHHLG